MPYLIRVLLLSLSLAPLVGCTSKPVMNIQQEVPANSLGSAADTQKAIIQALTQRQWLVQEVSPSEIRAQITVRGQHHAEINIPYSAAQFAIEYRSSWGLNYKDGDIHRSYNKWVDTLRGDILQALQAQSLLAH